MLHLPDEEVDFASCISNGYYTAQVRRGLRDQNDPDRLRPTQNNTNTGRIQTNVAKTQRTGLGHDPPPTGATQNSESEPSQVVWPLKEKPQHSSKTIMIQNLRNITLTKPRVQPKSQRAKSHGNRTAPNLVNDLSGKSRVESTLPVKTERFVLWAVFCILHFHTLRKMGHIPKYKT